MPFPRRFVHPKHCLPSMPSRRALARLVVSQPLTVAAVVLFPRGSFIRSGRHCLRASPNKSDELMDLPT